MDMADVKKDHSLELNLMFQNLKAKELDVIITRKENSVTERQYSTLLSEEKKIPQTLQPGHPLASEELLCTREKCYC